VEKKEHAIVLQKRNYGESDLLVTLFLLQGGKRTGIAKGAKRSRKRFGAALETGSVIELSFKESTQRELLFLQEASLVDPNTPLWRKSWETIAIASYCLELAAKFLPENQESGDKFRLLEMFLADLEEEGALEALFAFEFDWLKACGWEPDLNRCHFCAATLGSSNRQETFDHYWEHTLGKPLVSKKLLDQVLL